MAFSFRRDERGNVALLFALAVPGLLAAVGSAVDYSDMSRRRADLQKVADAAAIAGAQTLAATSREQDARTRAERFVDGQITDIAKAVTTSFEKRTVTVDLSLENKLSFGGFIGQPTQQVSVRAIASYGEQMGACLVALGKTEDAGIHLVGSAKIVAPKCSVESNAPGANSIKTQGAAKITAGKVCTNGGGGKASTSPPAKDCDDIEDPYKERPVKCGPDQTMACPEKTGGNTSTRTTAASSYTGPCLKTDYEVRRAADQPLKPGVYCGGLSIRADTTMEPGFYQIQDGALSIGGNTSVTGTGVSILLSGNNAVLDLQGSPRLRLSAMTTGPLAGIAITSNTPAAPPLTSNIQGSPDMSLSGSIWLPGQRLKMQGSPTLTVEGRSDKVIAYGFDLHGSPDLIIRADAPENRKSGFAQVRLAQ